jgi:HD-GYP domain-containing protein (c-di-GMP phosphodiesterase class II)
MSDTMANVSAAMANPQDLDQANEMIRRLQAENDRLNDENRGLADEVLRSYEQINVIFDISAQVAILNDGREVRRLLLTKLRYMFHADAVFLFPHDANVVIKVGDDDVLCQSSIGTDDSSIGLPPGLDEVRQRLNESQRVFVLNHRDDSRITGHGTSMWGPLKEGSDEYSIIGITRRDQPLESGDMLLLDSTLTYGGHILSNLQLVDQIKKTNFETVRALVHAIDQKDNYTSGHSERVGFLAKVVGQRMGLPAKTLQVLEWTGLLHDIGKIGIPGQVLKKPGRLTPEEYAIIQEHPSRSFEVLKPVASLEPVLDGVLYHHENPDGSGYPKGLKGDEIPLAARIVHVVDVYDALTSTRSYRSAFDHERATEIMKNDAGTRLDAEVVRQFLAAWADLPQTHPEQFERWFGSSHQEVES